MNARLRWAGVAVGIAIAIVTSVGCAVAEPLLLPAAGFDGGAELAARLFTWINGHVQGIIATAYERAPVLVVVMAALLIIPTTALAALLAHAMRLRWLRSRRPSLAAEALAKFKPSATPAPSGAALWPQFAWLEVEAGNADPHRVALPHAQGLVRIGRHEDNDIQLPLSTVHRHHALIHRTPAAEFVIMDLSGQEGNGVVVNGEKRAEARLAPGDLIVLGDARLRFDSAPL